MASSGKSVTPDTLDTVRVKILNNIRSLGSTLQIASDDLRTKGYNVPDGQVFTFGINMSIGSINPDNLVIDLLKRSKHLWDDLFAMNPATVTEKHIEEIKTILPPNLSGMVGPLLDCRDSNGVLALDTKILGLLINYLKAFVKLGLKIVYFRREYETTLSINLNEQLVLRKVEGLPA
jgi:hypothetical protein